MFFERGFSGLDGLKRISDKTSFLIRANQLYPFDPRSRSSDTFYFERNNGRKSKIENHKGSSLADTK